MECRCKFSLLGTEGTAQADGRAHVTSSERVHFIVILCFGEWKVATRSVIAAECLCPFVFLWWQVNDTLIAFPRQRKIVGDVGPCRN